MLDVLCGSKNVQKILIFLFVNGKCYGTELHRALKTSLTPIQKALNRLENGRLITSYFEGKTRIYHFNPAYPLLKELEELLKKAFTLLPPHEQKSYYAIKSSNKDAKQVLLAFWEKLKSVKQLTFLANTEEVGWSGKGRGEVVSIKKGDNVLVFNEKGTWQDKQGSDVSFSNAFRWTFDYTTQMISLEHLRRGLENPVFLFNLSPSGKNSLSSVDSHLCGEDSYFGQIYFDQNSFRLNWRIIGPKKNEELNYYYY